MTNAEIAHAYEIADRIEHTMRELRLHYAEVARRWQQGGLIDDDTDPEYIGAVLLGIVHAFALQRLLIPGTEAGQYLSGVRGLFTVGARV